MVRHQFQRVSKAKDMIWYKEKKWGREKLGNSLYFRALPVVLMFCGSLSGPKLHWFEELRAINTFETASRYVTLLTKGIIWEECLCDIFPWSGNRCFRKSVWSSFVCLNYNAKVCVGRIMDKEPFSGDQLLVPLFNRIEARFITNTESSLHL